MSVRRPSIGDLKRGEPEAWRWFVREYGPAVTGYARRLGHSDPEEVTGATLETIARRIVQFEGGHGDLRSFVFSIAHARIVDDVRRRSRRQEVDVDWATQPAVDITDDVVESQQPELLAAIEMLSDDVKHMLHLRYVQGLSTKETARALGKSEVATRVALSRSVARLRGILGDDPFREQVDA